MAASPRALLRWLLSLFSEPKYFWIMSCLVVLADTLFTQVIIRFVPYTEIDWETYMIQTKLYDLGERNYTQITGPTGPLVYPAGHVHIHHILRSITDEGDNIALAQQIYGALYIVTLGLTCAIYNKAGGIPNWVLILLPLSKRLHSIFVLRLFNDCWSVLAVLAAILSYQSRLPYLGTMLFSLGVSVKMSALLYFPGLLVILFKMQGLIRTVHHCIILVLVQGILAKSFLEQAPSDYFNLAFEFSRVFKHKWTVNWRFVDEQTFISRPFALALLIGQIVVLIAFGLFRWCRSDGGVFRTLNRGLRRPSLPASVVPVTPDQMATILFTSNLIGILFARSLHYQFYSWYAQQLPFLMWRTRYPVFIKLLMLFSIEYAWNVFPSTNLSSAILLLCNALLLVGIWFGDSEGKTHTPVEKKPANRHLKEN